MTLRNIQKSLIGMEDFQQGVGKVTQTRAGSAFEVGKVDVPYAVTSIAGLQDVVVERFTSARVYAEPTTSEDYVYIVGTFTGIASNNDTTGSWVLCAASTDFSTIEALEASALAEGTCVSWSGYYEKQDGGDNIGVVVAGGTGVPDKGRFFNLANGLQVSARSPTSVKQWGVNASQTDNAAAITRAISSGLTLDWHSDEYVTQSGIAATVVSDLHWYSSGASIRLDSASDQEAVLNLTVEPNVDCYLSGLLTLDANDLAYAGLVVRNSSTPIVNFPSDAPNLILADLTVKSIYRAAQVYGVGDGISIVGSFNQIILTRPRVLTVRMAPGAGIPTVVGISGITIADDNAGGYPYSVVIEDCYIDRVFSEDAAYVLDQDGMRLFTDRSASAEHTKTSMIVRGGTITNSRNRSIKCQTQTVQISDLKIVKDSSVDIAGAGITQNPDIDLQTGGGFVKNIEYYYDNFVGTELLRYDEDSTDREPMPSLIVEGLIGVFTAATVQIPEAVVKPFSDNTRNTMQVSINNIQVIGLVRRLVSCRVSGPGRTLVNVANCFANATEEFIDSISGGDASYFLSGCHQTGTAIPVFSDTSGNDQIISVVNSSGFTSEPDIDITGPYAPSTRVHSIAPLTARETGVLRPFTARLVPDELVELPISGASSGSYMLVIHVGRGGGAGLDSIICGCASGSSGDVVALSNNSATRWSTSNGLSEPVGAPEDYWLWGNNSTPGGGPFLRNNTTSTRTFTCFLLG